MKQEIDCVLVTAVNADRFGLFRSQVRSPTIAAVLVGQRVEDS